MTEAKQSHEENAGSHDQAAELLIDKDGQVFELLETLGQGGMGVVRKARQVQFDRIVAVKLLHDYFFQTTAAVTRLQKEATALGRLHHPNIVRVYALSMSRDRKPFIVMELINGKTLSELIKADGPLHIDTFKMIFLQVLAALQSAHEAGFIHRDLTPSNMMQLENGTIKLMDFGLVKGIAGDTGGIQQSTQTGHLSGSPSYMSPEQCMGKPIRPSSDIYSLACVMFEALTGRRLFAGDSHMEIMYKHIQGMTLSQGDLDLDVCAMLSKALAKNPEDRFQSASEMAAVISKLETRSLDSLPKRSKNRSQKDEVHSRSGKPHLRPQLTKISIALLFVATASIAGLYYLKNSTDRDSNNTKEAVTVSDALIGARRLLASRSPDLPTVQHNKDDRAAGMQLLEAMNNRIGGTPTDWRSTAEIYRIIGELLSRTDGDTAIKVYNKALIGQEKTFTKLSAEYCAMLAHVGHLNLDYRHFDEAHRCFEEVIQLRTQMALQSKMGYMLLGEANVDLSEYYLRRNDLDSAERSVNEALRCYNIISPQQDVRPYFAKSQLLHIMEKRRQWKEIVAQAWKTSDDVSSEMDGVDDSNNGTRSLRLELEELALTAAANDGDQQAEREAHRRCFDIWKEPPPLKAKQLSRIALNYAGRLSVRGAPFTEVTSVFEEALEYAVISHSITSKENNALKERLKTCAFLSGGKRQPEVASLIEAIIAKLNQAE